MLLLSVELENIKRYRKASFDFPEGIIAICGANGAGKTTILEAIGFALFDWLPYAQADFVRRGEKNGTVRVSFRSQLDERTYTVVRNCQGQYYVYDPELKQKPVEQKADVQRWLRAHMGLAPTIDLANLFVTALGVPQGTFTADFLKTPALRKKVFDPLLRVEEYKAAAEQLSETVKLLQSERHGLDRDLAAAQARLTELVPTRERLQALETDLATSRTKADQLDRRRQEQQALVVQLDEQATTMASLQKRLAVEEERLLSLTAQLKGCQDQITQAEAAAAVVAAHQGDHDGYRSAQQAVADLEPKLALREEQQKNFQRLEARFIEDAAKLEGLRQQLAALAEVEVERAALTPRLEAWRALEEEGNRLAEAERKRQQERQALQNTQRQLASLHERRQKATDELQALAPTLAQAAALGQREAEATMALQAVATIQQAAATLAALEPRLTALEASRAETTTRQTRLAAEMVRLQGLAPLAEKLDGLQQAQAEHLSAVGAARATAESLRLWQGKIEGGICPFLAAECLNLAEGQSLDKELARSIAAAETAVAEGQQHLQALDGEVAQARQAAQAVSALPDIGRQLDEAKAAMTSVDTQLEQLGGQRDELTRQAAGLADAQARLAQAQAALADAQRAAQAAAKADVLQRLDQDLQAQAEALAQEITRYEQSLASLGELDQQLAAHQATLSQTPDPRPAAHGLDARLAEAPLLRERIHKGEGIVATVQAKKAALEAELKESEGLVTALSVERERLSRHQAGYQLVLQHQVMARALPGLQGEAERLGKLGQEATVTVGDLQEHHQRLQTSYDATAHQAARDTLQSLVAEQAQITERLRGLGEQIEEHRARIEQLVLLQRQSEDLLASRAALDQIADFLDVGRSALREAGPRLTLAYLQSISEEANRLYREITGQGWTELRWADDYEILLNEAGHDRSFANLSGGEQMAASLAVRLALLKEISALDIAFFDEPTTNLDEERRRNLAKQLPQVKGFRQLVVISHDDTFEEVTDHLLRVDEAAELLIG